MWNSKQEMRTIQNKEYHKFGLRKTVHSPSYYFHIALEFYVRVVNLIFSLRLKLNATRRFFLIAVYLMFCDYYYNPF